MPSEQFKAKNICVLNPTFGAGSELVGGADADLLIDDVLLDIKTTKEASLSQEYYNQLVGNYILWKIGGEIGSLKECRISALGIYFSRHARLHTIPTNIVEENVHLGEFIDWFKEKAKQEYKRRQPKLETTCVEHNSNVALSRASFHTSSKKGRGCPSFLKSRYSNSSRRLFLA